MSITPLQQFRAKWSRGCGSELCSHALNIVLCRGTIPCDILLIGEGPGESEDTLARPFCGPAGQLLDQIIEQAIPKDESINEDDEPEWYPKYTHALTNLVCCIPRDQDGGKAGPPDTDSIIKCQPRLEEFIRLCNPRLIVRVGGLAEKWVGGGMKHTCKIPQGCEVLDIVHPAFILRANMAQRGLLAQRCIVQLRNAVEKLDAF